MDTINSSHQNLLTLLQNSLFSKILLLTLPVCTVSIRSFYRCSNQGNRLENIRSAIALIHKTIGTVIKVSRLYETPSWGFDSEAFYNCLLLLHTRLSATNVLEEILRIEKVLWTYPKKSNWGIRPGPSISTSSRLTKKCWKPKPFTSRIRKWKIVFLYYCPWRIYSLTGFIRNRGNPLRNYSA